ncbi:hypothetical protein Q5P01_004077 [Channa striata]|uniref:Uncharacterized protein n=1 Tax=Channa striata TaxID=64152 RepID=A0AA88TA11_CHASR|nr:hypothetical protein Q5P01_004077 [Channa striata]
MNAHAHRKKIHTRCLNEKPGSQHRRVDPFFQSTLLSNNNVQLHGVKHVLYLNVEEPWTGHQSFSGPKQRDKDRQLTCMYLDCGRKPTQAQRICKLHTERPWLVRDANPQPSSCDAALLTTPPPCCCTLCTFNWSGFMRLTTCF